MVFPAPDGRLPGTYPAAHQLVERGPAAGDGRIGNESAVRRQRLQSWEDLEARLANAKGVLTDQVITPAELHHPQPATVHRLMGLVREPLDAVCDGELDPALDFVGRVLTDQQKEGLSVSDPARQVIERGAEFALADEVAKRLRAVDHHHGRPGLKALLDDLGHDGLEAGLARFGHQLAEVDEVHALAECLWLEEVEGLEVPHELSWRIARESSAGGLGV